MSNWSEGYVTDITYTHGYYHEMSPRHALVPLLQAGIAMPEVKNACELGFGQGVSINIHAAGSDAQWYGTDFNPAQVSFAREWAAESGSGAKLSDQAFAEFCQRDDLPEFGYIGLHGIWSWISDENRHIIVDFIRRKLAVGGVLYISYNTLPGWAATSPIQHLLSVWDKNMAASTDDYRKRVTQAVAFGSEIFAQSNLQQKSSELSEFIEDLKKKDYRYLAHEYFNQEWRPMYFTEVADHLESAKLNYVCSSSYLEDFTNTNFSNEQEEIFNKLPNYRMQQTAKDYMLGRRFRRDLWVKGGVQLSGKRLNEARGRLQFMLITDRDKLSGVLTYYRQTQLINEHLDAILDVIGDKKPHRLSDIYAAIKDKNIMNEPQLFMIMALLFAKKDVVLVQEQETIAAAKKKCDALNQHIMTLAENSQQIAHLASPVTGEAVVCSQLDMLFTAAVNKGISKSKQMAQHVWDIFKLQGSTLNKDGQPLQGDEANLAELERLAGEFNENKLALLRQLGIAKK
ncbi:class I SAM-dependent methyltransferase [Bergeriella denitrificans]|uniref:Methyltransferase domain protein n=1 Tax=Bergeriella denitrificans TaxID=494 RepID=A0A378UFF7_BERDE|nr:class I SAM-dependent methyltransferase [Bergeriella denitrificans]STZ75910.1 methyltransferase domain protein [Bergeriella denitrificans]